MTTEDGDMRYHGLLHVGDGGGDDVNLRSRGSHVDVYLRCAALLRESCRACGVSFALVTNEPPLVARAAARLGLTELPAVGIAFSTLPKGTPF